MNIKLWIIDKIRWVFAIEMVTNGSLKEKHKMTPTTRELVCLLIRAKDRKTSAMSSRRDNLGIAVREDHFAKVWQKADRQERKILLILNERLGETHNYSSPYNDGEKWHLEFCGRCGWRKACCTCEEKGWPHVEHKPVELVNELLESMDIDEVFDTFERHLDGTCRGCGSEINAGHALCAECAHDEYHQWEGFIGRGY